MCGPPRPGALPGPRPPPRTSAGRLQEPPPARPRQVSCHSRVSAKGCCTRVPTRVSTRRRRGRGVPRIPHETSRKTSSSVSQPWPRRTARHGVAIVRVARSPTGAGPLRARTRSCPCLPRAATSRSCASSVSSMRTLSVGMCYTVTALGEPDSSLVDQDAASVSPCRPCARAAWRVILVAAMGGGPADRRRAERGDGLEVRLVATGGKHLDGSAASARADDDTGAPWTTSAGCWRGCPRPTCATCCTIPPVGVFNRRSWSFWRRRLGLDPAAGSAAAAAAVAIAAMTLTPMLDVLPEAQRALWPALGFPEGDGSALLAALSIRGLPRRGLPVGRSGTR